MGKTSTAPTVQECRKSRTSRQAAIWLLGMLLGCASAWASDPPTPRQFYQSRCANCHGADGRGTRLRIVFPAIPDFTNPEWQAVHTKAQLKKILLRGKGAMPGYQGDLDGLTAEEIIRYLRKFAPKDPSDSAKTYPSSNPHGSAIGDESRSADADPPTATRRFYQQHCANCHGADGRGARLRIVFPAIPDFTSSEWQAVHTKAQQEKIILQGKGAMPAYKGDLDGLTADEIIRYLRTFAPQEPPPKPKK
jgi:mono/diheme cytochrome c family protein